jgi:hypothetical protein
MQHKLLLAENYKMEEFHVKMLVPAKNVIGDAEVNVDLTRNSDNLGMFFLIRFMFAR